MPGRGQRGGRGRGRGQARGSGRGRGGYRGRGRRANQSSQNSPGNVNRDWESDDALTKKTNEAQQELLDVEKIEDLRKYFVETAAFEEHYDAQEKNKNRYVAGMAVLELNGVELSQNAKVRALAAAWARHDHDLANSFLCTRERFGLVEVLKALTLLDCSRRIRVEEKKVKRLQLQNNGKLKPKMLGKIKSNIDNLTNQKPKYGSASGAVCRHIREWVKSFTKDELEFYALHFPTEPWKKLADICHFHPKKDFPALDWFLPFCFGSPAPEGTMVAQCRDVTEESVNKLLEEFSVPYSHIKEFKGKLTERSKSRIAATDRLDQIIWWYEDLQCDDVDDIIDQRLEEGQELSLPYGKLMERLLTIKMIREGLPLRSRLTLEAPVVVIGDRSGSMEVAIRTSTIIASLLTAICSAKLVFFDSKNMDAPFIPSNIEDVLEMAVTIHTGGSTCPAASLWPFYEQKEVVKTFIMVTDEEENGSCNNYRFASLFKLYHEEVYPAKLVFVSFLRNQHDEGYMVRELEKVGITENVMQFKFDQTRPDLTKLDKLFGLLSTETEDFEQQVQKMEVDIAADGMHSVLQKLKLYEKGNITQ